MSRRAEPTGSMWVTLCVCVCAASPLCWEEEGAGGQGRACNGPLGNPM